MSKNYFEIATRNKYRFKATNGNVSVEDLWALTPNQLNEIAKDLHREISENSVSFLSEEPKVNTETANKLEVVKHIITVKLAEKKARDQARERAERKQQILKLLEERNTQALGAMSEDQLRQELAALSTQDTAE